MKLLFVVNPISGGVDKKPFLRKARSLCKRYGIDHHIFKTTGKDDKKQLNKILVSYKPDRVASVGGDGTTLFSATALLGTEIPMGIVPLGSANGMAEELFVDPDPEKALKDIIMSEIFGDLDMVMVNDQYYSIHIGDVGVNAHIVDAYEKDKNRGMTTYAKYFIEELQRIKPFDVKIVVNEQEYRENGVMVAICNSRKYGTGVPLNPNGNPMDGKFEIVVVQKMDTKTLIRAGLSKYDESYVDYDNARVISSEEAVISFDQPRLLQLDGEVIGKFKELKVQILKAAVKLITHSDNIFVK